MDRVNDEDVKDPGLVAYRLYDQQAMQLVPAPSARDWMDATSNRFAYRCLPLLIANQSGWFILGGHEIRLTWNGSNDLGAIKIEVLEGPEPYPALSHFGHGIITWTLPFIFCTSPGYNLLARGPANMPKAGISALEGVIETDWSVATFTMNWQMTVPNLPVTFAVGEPICMLVPQRRGELERFRTESVTMDWTSELGRAHRHWADSRNQFLSELKAPDSEARARGWEKDYFRGGAPSGVAAPDHQVKLSLKEFAEVGKGR